MSKMKYELFKNLKHFYNGKRFYRTLLKVIDHNEYKEIDVESCTKQEKWTPVDLIIREYLNNGGGSSKEFLGCTMGDCRNAYNFICSYKDFFINNNLINKQSWNNSGFLLWDNYNFGR